MRDLGAFFCRPVILVRERDGVLQCGKICTKSINIFWASC